MKKRTVFCLTKTFVSNTVLRFLSIVLILVLMPKCQKRKTADNKPLISSFEFKKQQKYIRSIHIKSPLANTKYAARKVLNIDFSIKKNTPLTDSFHIFIDRQKITTLKGDIQSFDWIPSDKKMGTHLLKILAFHNNNQIGIANSNFIILADTEPKNLSYTVVNTIPHDKKAFTQGLVYNKGFLYESTGQYGRSGIRKIEIGSGNILGHYSNPKRYFGEGITIMGNRIFQLTWISGEAFIYDKQTLKQTGSFYITPFSSQGWGITNTTDELIISNGSHQLFFVDPQSFDLIRKIEVCDNKDVVKNLNELEYINGHIFANVWMSDTIVVINPHSGKVVGKIGCPNLLTKHEKKRIHKIDDVLNGIAYNADNKCIYLTGKRWPKIFEIVLIE